MLFYELSMPNTYWIQKDTQILQSNIWKLEMCLTIKSCIINMFYKVNNRDFGCHKHNTCNFIQNMQVSARVCVWRDRGIFLPLNHPWPRNKLTKVDMCCRSQRYLLCQCSLEVIHILYFPAFYFTYDQIVPLMVYVYSGINVQVRTYM